MTSASKGHAMNRGTLMVLKRLLVTALGAMGLGALAAGTALGQTPGEGNVPAPNIFDDQVTCSSNVPPGMGPDATPRPTVIPEDEKMSPLDMAIGMGTLEIMSDSQTYMDLVYVIPPMGNNCGGANPFGPMAIDVNNNMEVDPGDTLAASADTIAVATGYSELLTKFAAVYGAPEDTASTGTAGVLAAAQKALNTAIENGLSGAALKPAEDRVAAAQKAHDEKLAIFTDAAAGSIYQAGVAEWMAKAAVTKSIEDYNAQVVKTNMALAALDALDYSKYVSLINDDLLTVVTVTAGMAGDPDLAALATYANAVVGMSTVGTVDPDTGVTTTTASNFDAAGRLLVPMELDTSTIDVDDDLRAVVDTADNMVSEIRTRRDNYAVAAAALQELADDTREATGGASPLQLAYDEAARRAQVEANYYNEVYNAMLGDTTMQDSGVNDDAATDVDESMTNIATLNGAYTTENNKRFVAETDLRSKAAVREAATAHVQGSFSNPTAFYGQLVARRQAEKVTADRRVAKASEDGGTASKSLTDAATKAAENLASAQETNGTVQAQFAAADDPTLALVQELLKNGGDDGQALVDAIGTTYQKAAGAAAEAETAVNEALAGLTGTGGAIDLNTQRSTENAGSIVELDGRVTQNEEDIASNTTMIGENRGMIMTNTGAIAANAESIVANTGHIMENRGMIETNAGDILTNSGHIMGNRGMIETNAAGISTNADAIAANMNSIGSNSASISDNRNMIGELSDDLDIVRAGVAASMALAGMPAINGRGISIGVGSFDGESAFAVGFQIQGEMASFKVGLTSGGGATGASAGVGFQF